LVVSSSHFSNLNDVLLVILVHLRILGQRIVQLPLETIEVLGVNEIILEEHEFVLLLLSLLVLHPLSLKQLPRVFVFNIKTVGRSLQFLHIVVEHDYICLVLSLLLGEFFLEIEDHCVFALELLLEL
jgi:hypothetical protein